MRARGYRCNCKAYLALDEVADTGLGHDGNGDSGHDLLDHLGIGHPRNSSLGADVCWHTLQCHHGAGAGLLSYSCLWWGGSVTGRYLVLGALRSQARESCAHLFSVDHIHDDTSLQHAGEAGLDREGRLGVAIRDGGAIGGEFSCHGGCGVG
jgi:hypothetical protein